MIVEVVQHAQRIKRGVAQDLPAVTVHVLEAGGENLGLQGGHILLTGGQRGDGVVDVGPLAVEIVIKEHGGVSVFQNVLGIRGHQGFLVAGQTGEEDADLHIIPILIAFGGDVIHGDHIHPDFIDLVVAYRYHGRLIEGIDVGLFAFGMSGGQPQQQDKRQKNGTQFFHTNPPLWQI